RPRPGVLARPRFGEGKRITFLVGTPFVPDRGKSSGAATTTLSIPVELLVRHGALVVLGAGACAAFALNLGLEPLLSARDYGRYSLLWTWIAVVSASGFLGFNHRLLRQTEVREGAVYYAPRILRGALAAATLSTAGASIAIHHSDLVEVGWPFVAVCLALN